MRVTSSMYYNNLYGTNNNKMQNAMFDVNKQIASGLKIQYASDDVRAFSETMRLDNELTTINQIKISTQSGYKVSNQTDITMNEFGDSMTRMRTLMLQAANGVNDDTSLDSIAGELRGIEKNLISLANTSINGQYLFSGSAVDTKPISDDGVYHGNDKGINAFLGTKNQQQYNITGADLFLGEEKLTEKEVISNVFNTNAQTGSPIGTNNTIRELMGDKDGDPTTINTNYFYLSGTKHSGESFKEKIVVNDNLEINELLTKIGQAYGNTGDLDIVNVNFNKAGQIMVHDKVSGSSKLDFHLVGAVDFSGGVAADVTVIDSLDVGESTYPPAGDLFIKEFMKSGFDSAVGAPANIEGIVYDRTTFSKKGSNLSSNIAHVLKDTNAFASPSTKISEVADLSKGTAGTLDGTTFKLVGNNISGIPFDVDIDLKSTANGGSTFSIAGNTYSIYNMDVDGRAAVDADEITYKQLTDVMNMVTTGVLPANATELEYDTATENSTTLGSTYLTYNGKIEFKDIGSVDTKAVISMYDVNSGDFTKDASVLTFNANNALTISDPKTDFFKSIDMMISSVENHKLYADASNGDKRVVGIENAIAMMDNLQEHTFRTQAKVGAQSNTLSKSLERTELMEISTLQLRSSVVDTDLAEASIRLQQLNLNFEAMLSTIGKVAKLNLVNYL